MTWTPGLRLVHLDVQRNGHLGKFGKTSCNWVFRGKKVVVLIIVE